MKPNLRGIRKWSALKLGREERERRALVRECGFWFVDIPRTSSTSICIELSRHYGAVFGKQNLLDTEYATTQVFPDHVSALAMRNRLGHSLWNELFTFSIVRNPWDRTYSLFRYRRVKGSIPPDLLFEDYLHRLADSHTTDDPLFRFAGHRLGAADFLTDNKGNIIVDFVGKYENRAEFIHEIRGRVAVPNLGELWLQGVREPTPGSRPQYADAFTPATKEIVGALYARDVDLFDYDFD